MTLFYYVLKDYLKYVVGTIFLTVFLFILFDFIHRTTKYFPDYKPSTELIVRFYLFQIPSQIVQALPIAGLLASVVCMILLSRTNEVTAMRAAGMGPLRIGLPLGVGGFLLSLVALLLGELYVPKFSQKSHYIQSVEIEGGSDTNLREGARWIRDGDRLINFRDYDNLSQTLVGVRILDLRPNFRPKRSIEAEHAKYSDDTKAWTLEGAKVLHFKRSGVIEKVERRAQEVLKLPIEPTKLKKDLRKPNELSLRELAELIDRGERSGIDVLPYKVDYHGKLAYPFAAFVVSLIGLKFGYRSERTTETAKGIVLAFVIGISYWFILSAGRALGVRGDVPPFVAAWAPNVCILSITMFDAWRGRAGA